MTETNPPEKTDTALPGKFPEPLLSEKLLAWCDRNRWWIFTGLAALYLAGFNGQWWIGHDSAIALNIARNIYNGLGYTHPLGLQLQVPPGLPYMLAGTMLVTGTDNLWLADVVMLGIAGLGLFLAYRLFLLYADRPTAVLLVALLGASRWYYQFAFILLADLPFLIGVLLLLLGWERIQQRYQAGYKIETDHSRLGATRATALSFLMIALGIAIMVVFRTVALTVLAAGIFACAWITLRQPKLRKIGMIALAGTITATAIVIALGPSSGPVATDQQIISFTFSNISHTLTYTLPHNAWVLFGREAAYGVLGLEIAPWASFIISIWALGCGALLVRKRPLWGFIVLGFTAQMLLFFATARYLLAFLPILLIGWWTGALWAEKKLTRKVSVKTGAWVFLFILMAWFACNLTKSIDVAIEQHRLPRVMSVFHGQFIPTVKISRYIKANTPQNAVILTGQRSDREDLMYLSDRLVIPAYRFPLSKHKYQPGHIYAILPADDNLTNLLKKYHWRLGRTLIKIPGNNGKPIELKPVVQQSK